MRKDTTSRGIRATPVAKRGTNGNPQLGKGVPQGYPVAAQAALGMSEDLLPHADSHGLQRKVAVQASQGKVARGSRGAGRHAKTLDQRCAAPLDRRERVLAQHSTPERGADRKAAEAKTAEWEKEQILIARYHLQSVAAKLMPHEAVAKCHRQIIGSTATLLYIPSSDTAAYGHLESCHSVWMCAVCSAKISYHRQTELRQALHNADELGYQYVLTTYTFAHYKGDNLRANLDAMLAARRGMVSGRAATEIKERFGVLGSIRSLEVTIGPNGYHPHIHEITFFKGDVDLLAYEQVMRARWEEMAAKRGLAMNEHGFQMDSVDYKIADYVAKFGHEPGEKTLQAWLSGDWDEAAEVTQWHRKQGHDGHYTPFDLLRFADAGSAPDASEETKKAAEEAAKLFRIYAAAFKGRRQVFFPPALRKLLGVTIEEKSDEEIVESHELDKQEVAAIDRKLFYGHIRGKKHARAKILNAVRRAKGDVAQVAEYLALNFDAVLDTSGPDLPIFRYVDDMPDGGGFLGVG